MARGGSRAPRALHRARAQDVAGTRRVPPSVDAEPHHRSDGDRTRPRQAPGPVRDRASGQRGRLPPGAGDATIAAAPQGRGGRRSPRALARRHPGDAGRAMKVSVVAPVRNEETTVEALIDSLLAQTCAPDEIVLADGGSTDATVAVARRYADRGIRVMEIGPAYPGRGRNEGIRMGRNDWIALIDAGCVADPGWLENLVRVARDLGERPSAVFGEYLPVVETEWEAAQALAFVGPVDSQTGCRSP